MELPLVASCELDADGLSAQRERYREAGEGAIVLERSSRRLVVEISAQGASAVPELVEVERRCCPFFAIDWNPEPRRFSIGVSEPEHEPALAAIAFALGLSAARV
jgi:hypothetical protein